MKPTPKRNWVRVGDRCTAGGTMPGTVVRIIRRSDGLPTAVVRWASGSTGRHTITTLFRIEAACRGCTMKGGVHVIGCRVMEPPRGLNPNPCACIYCDRTVGPGGYDWTDDGLHTYAHAKCHRENCR
jgi:hypothetical protein